MTRIAVIIPSRKRPESLKAVLRALQASASGIHAIHYAVSFCRDDLATEAAACSVPFVSTFQRPADCTPGAAFNHAVRKMPPADVYTGFCDDVFPLTYKWDEHLAHALRHPLVCFCWQEVTDPLNASYIASAGRVVKAIGDLCPEYFPYWFSDLWLAEIHHLAFGFRPSLVDGLQLVGKRGTTQGFRDFTFWCRVFAHTRPERLRAAVKLAAEYGSVPPDVRGTMEVCRAFDADFQSKAPLFETRFADPKVPELYYQKAKARAEAMLTNALINA